MQLKDIKSVQNNAVQLISSNTSKSSDMNIEYAHVQRPSDSHLPPAILFAQSNIWRK